MNGGFMNPQPLNQEERRDVKQEKEELKEPREKDKVAQRSEVRNMLGQLKDKVFARSHKDRSIYFRGSD
jgi:hypothetical protein